MSKKKVLFYFVEAGMGHIMPMQAAYEAFNQKYGDMVIAKPVHFFHTNDDADLKAIETDFVNEVKKHNRFKGRGFLQYNMIKLFGQKLSLDFLFRKRYKKGLIKALNIIEDEDADLIFHTHLSTLYYGCEAKELGMTKAKNIAYCPDPVIGLQWDKRADLFVQSHRIKKYSDKKEALIREIPFLLRTEVKTITQSKKAMRVNLDLNPDNFTVLLVDGAYGEGKMRKTIYELMQLTKPLTMIAVCGKNDKLKHELDQLELPKHITLKTYGFTDQILKLTHASDVFIGKAGASNLAEATYFDVPSIITLCVSPIEKWIKTYHVNSGTSLYIKSVKSVRTTIESWMNDQLKMAPLIQACQKQDKTLNGPNQIADILMDALN